MKNPIIFYKNNNNIKKLANTTPTSTSINEKDFKPEPIKIAELLTILSGSMIIWYSMFRYITNIPSTEECVSLTLGVTLSHFLCIILISCSLIVLFSETVSSTDIKQKHIDRLSYLRNKCITFLKLGWLPIVITSLIQFLLLSITIGSNPDYIFPVTVFSSWMLTILIFKHLFNIRFKKILTHINRLSCTIKLSILPILSFAFFCGLMIFFSSEVEYKFDKDYYKLGEKPVLYLKRAGYMVTPLNLKIAYDYRTIREVENKFTNHIELDVNLSDNETKVIELTYETQLFNLKKSIRIMIPKIEKH